MQKFCYIRIHFIQSNLKAQVLRIVRRYHIHQLEKYLDETQQLEKTVFSQASIGYQLQLRVPVHVKGGKSHIICPVSITIKERADFTILEFQAIITKFIVYSLIASLICPLLILLVEYGVFIYIFMACLFFVLLYSYFMSQLHNRVNELIKELKI